MTSDLLAFTTLLAVAFCVEVYYLSEYLIKKLVSVCVTRYLELKDTHCCECDVSGCIFYYYFSNVDSLHRSYRSQILFSYRHTLCNLHKLLEVANTKDERGFIKRLNLWKSKVIRCIL
jgi:hypothetical protein